MTGEKPVVGAFVTASEDGYSGGYYTDAEGRFTLLVPGEGRVTFSIDRVDIVAGSHLDVRHGVNLHRIQIVGTGEISGHVLFEGLPIEGADVTLDQVATIRTNNEGTFRFGAVVPGTRILTATSTDLRAQSPPQSLQVLASSVISNFDIALDRGASIEGDIVDNNGNPVPDVLTTFACVECSDSGQTLTNLDGKFRIENLRGGGVYRAYVSTPEMAPYPSSVALPSISLQGNDNATGIRIRIDGAIRTIEGRALASKGIPASPIAVVAFNDAHPYGTIPVARTRSREDGSFVLRGLPGGKYVVGLGDDGEKGNVPHVEAGTRNLDVYKHPTGRIVGNLENFSHGTVEVVILGAPFSQTYSRLSTASQTFEFAEIPEGKRWVKAYQNGSVAIEQVNVVAGQTSTVALAAQSVFIAGTLLKFAGMVSICDFNAILPDLGPAYMGSAYSDSVGHFSFRAIANYPLEVECRGAKRRGRASIGPLRADAAATVVVELTE